jgi:hypothetical protein
MAEDKRNRGDQSPGGTQEQERPRKDRKPGGVESPPGSGRAGKEDEDEPQQ